MHGQRKTASEELSIQFYFAQPKYDASCLKVDNIHVIVSEKWWWIVTALLVKVRVHEVSWYG